MAEVPRERGSTPFAATNLGERRKSEDGKEHPTLTIDLAKARALFIEWHEDEYNTDEELADYADRLIERLKAEASCTRPPLP